MAVIGLKFETAVSTSASVSTNRKGQGVNDLHTCLSLPALLDYQSPDFGFDLPQIGCLAHERGAVTQSRKEMSVVALKIVKEVFIQMVFEISAADFHRDDLFVS